MFHVHIKNSGVRLFWNLENQKLSFRFPSSALLAITYIIRGAFLYSKSSSVVQTSVLPYPLKYLNIKEI